MRACGKPEELLVLVALLTLRGHSLGRIADYEQARDLARAADFRRDAVYAGFAARAGRP